MKNYLVILAVVFLAACTKNNDQQATTTDLTDPTSQACDFGIKEFNQTLRPQVIEDEATARRKPSTTTTTTTTTTAPSGASVILLDFNGHTVSGTAWNGGNTFTCAPANMTSAEIDAVVLRVQNDYSPFNVVVTTDEAAYNAAGKRIRVIITETWQWYGTQTGGVSYVGTFTPGNNHPAFVFSSLLGYGSKKIAEAAAHEAAHAIGLYHQAHYENCVKVSDYHYGLGTGETSWAPIMGVGYSRNLTLWHNGANPYGCTLYQDDITIIKNAVGGMKADDHSNTMTGNTILTTSVGGIINASSDVDFFSIDGTTSRSINVTPGNVGTGNAGGNVDLVLKVYNQAGALVSTIDNPNTLNVGTTLPSGKYYLAVSTIANTFATSNYGMIGQYTISVQN